jgi:glycosyltransferase involved in cell wall biosynthesis
MPRPRNVLNKNLESLKLLVFLIMVMLVVYWIWQYFWFWVKFHFFSQTYIPSSVKSTPVLEEDKATYTWLIHKYVPLHNAGSEWMAHAINQYLVQQAGARVNVIVNKTNVNEFERVGISNKADIQSNTQILQHTAVILSHHTQMASAAYTAKQLKRPLVLLMHDAWQKHYVQEIYYLMGKNLYIVNNSKWIQEYYSQIKVPSIVVYPPVRWQEYATETTGEYITLINVNENKGGKTLVEIAKAMPDEHFMGVKGAYNKQYVDVEQKNIKYVPQTPDIIKIYSQTGILLMPSKEESWGRTAIEAMSSGIPVIAHPTPGLLESCSSAGIFCDRNDTQAWVREIRKLRQDKNYYAEKSTACLARAKELVPEPQLEHCANWLSTLRWRE